MKRRRNKNKEFLIFSICIVLVGIFQLIFILHLHRPGDGTNNDIKQEDEQLLARKKRDFLRQVDDIQQRTGSGGGSGGGNREHNNNVDNIQPKLNQYATKTDHDDDDDPDRDCIFRNSSLYRSVFVYPSPGELEWENDDGSILTKYGKARTSLYPWQEIDNRTKTLGEYHYRIRDARATQYTTEILVREILTNKQSCLRTTDPETASLFYIPYMARYVVYYFLFLHFFKAYVLWLLILFVRLAFLFPIMFCKFTFPFYLACFSIFNPYLSLGTVISFSSFIFCLRICDIKKVLNGIMVHSIQNHLKLHHMDKPL